MPQVGDALNFVFIFYKNFVPFSPASVTVQAYKPDGTALTPGAATLVATGTYKFTTTSDQAGRWTALATSSDSTVDLVDVPDFVDVDAARLPASLVAGRMDASVGAMASNVLTAASLAADAGAEIADSIWNEPTADHTTAGTFGARMHTLLADIWSYATRTLTSFGALAVDIAARLTNERIVISSPVAHNGAITIYPAADYAAADDQSIDITKTTWPTLTGATITFNSTAPELTGIAGSVVDADTLRIEFTSAQTADLVPNDYNYEITATIGGRTVMLADGPLKVKSRRR